MYRKKVAKKRYEFAGEKIIPTFSILLLSNVPLIKLSLIGRYSQVRHCCRIKRAGIHVRFYACEWMPIKAHTWNKLSAEVHDGVCILFLKPLYSSLSVYVFFFFILLSVIFHDKLQGLFFSPLFFWVELDALKRLYVVVRRKLYIRRRKSYKLTPLKIAARERLWFPLGTREHQLAITA